MKTEAKITINEIRVALSTDVALGNISQETADRISYILGLDWKEKQHKDRKDMDCFLDDLRELFEAYDAKFHLQGQYDGSIIVDNWSYSLGFGNPVYFDQDYIALLPKKWKRQQMAGRLHFPKTTKIEEIRPIFDAVRRVDRKSSLYVTDKKFNEIIKPYKK